MCALIDANVLSKVFNINDVEHKPFRAIALWVTEGNGCIVYGGSEYAKQLGTGKYLRLFTELRIAQRAFPVDGGAVDAREKFLKKKVTDKAFDDAHLLAIIAVSKCCLLCTGDIRLRPYFRRKDLYPKGVRIPKLYTKSHGKEFCTNSTVMPEKTYALSAWKKAEGQTKSSNLMALGDV